MHIGTIKHHLALASEMARLAHNAADVSTNGTLEKTEAFSRAAEGRAAACIANLAVVAALQTQEMLEQLAGKKSIPFASVYFAVQEDYESISPTKEIDNTRSFMGIQHIAGEKAQHLGKRYFVLYKDPWCSVFDAHSGRPVASVSDIETEEVQTE